MASAYSRKSTAEQIGNDVSSAALSAWEWAKSTVDQIGNDISSAASSAWVWTKSTAEQIGSDISSDGNILTAPSRKLCVFVLGVLVAIACRPCTATEYLLINNEFGIARDFAAISLSAPEVKNVRMFVDIERFVVPNTSVSENAELQKIALDDLSAKFRLVAKKDDANYLVQIRMEVSVDYATRNPRREPAQGFVMSSICRYPIGEIKSDCGNTQYDFFYKGSKREIFKRFFEMWLETLIKGKLE